MKLETPVRTLGAVDYQALKAAVDAVPPEGWLEDTMRQQAFDQHAHTQSIILLFSSNWPTEPVARRKGWDQFSPTAIPLMESILAAHYPPGGEIIRAVIAKLRAGGRINLHKDGHPSFAVSHRIHVPLTTNDEVEFVVRGVAHSLSEGEAYEISNVDYHAVTNRGSQDRVHLIFDYAPQ